MLCAGSFSAASAGTPDFHRDPCSYLVPWTCLLQCGESLNTGEAYVVFGEIRYERAKRRNILQLCNMHGTRIPKCEVIHSPV